MNIDQSEIHLVISYVGRTGCEALRLDTMVCCIMLAISVVLCNSSIKKMYSRADIVSVAVIISILHRRFQHHHPLNPKS